MSSLPREPVTTACSQQLQCGYIQPVGSRTYRGNDNYTARTDVISGGSERDVYLCNITSATSTIRDVTVRGNFLVCMGNYNDLLNSTAVGVRPITSLRQTALTTVQVSWSPIPELPLSGYRVYYSLASGNGGTRTKTVAGADITTTEITGFTNGETYNISVEAISNLSNVLPGVPEMRVINPRRACAARVTVVVLAGACLSVCLSVCQSVTTFSFSALT